MGRRRPDGYYRKAKAEGFAARSVYKLEQMDRRYKLLRRGQRVVDLGCHPGSWLQYAARRVGAGGLVVGVDLKPPTVKLEEWVRFVQRDVRELGAEDLKAFAEAFDVILSDVAPATTGIRHADEAASVQLVEAVLSLAAGVLKPGGALVAKVYEGGSTPGLLKRVKGMFAMAKAHKPEASRAGSRELYLVGRGFRPN